MYMIIFGLLLLCAALIFIQGLRKRSAPLFVLSILIAVLTFAFFWFMDFWGEALWFRYVGYPARFWKVFITKILLGVGGGIAGGLIMWFLTRPFSQRRLIKTIGIGVAIYIGAQGAVINWDKLLLFFNHVTTQIKDPILGKSTSFYLFVLPLYDTIYSILMLLIVVSIIVSVISLFFRLNRNGIYFETAAPEHLRRNPLFLSTAALFLLLAWGKYLDRFHLMYSKLGLVNGPGWTDVNIRMPMYIVAMIIMILLALVLLIKPVRQKTQLLFRKIQISEYYKPLALIISAAGIAVITWIVLLGFVPGIFQWLIVQPNEITREKPYIKNNIDFTRKAFGLERIEQRNFPVAEELTQKMIDQNQDIFQNIRLWDWRALDSVYKQFQEIRLYYEFADVDIDRYTYQDKYRSVMVSARELKLSNLPPESQTFVNKRFKYTHGFGITMAPVSKFTKQGLPELLVKNIPPESRHPELKVKQPRIYYGELTDSHVIVNSEEKELDYPKGDENVYIHYPGKGGVLMGNFWRKFLFGWKFDGTKLLLSGYPRKGSRIMFHRNIKERVKTLAPFLKLDDDPYIVMADGKLYWIVDAYTVSSDYPYSESYLGTTLTEGLPGRYAYSDRKLEGVNYIRNSVKAVVNAYNGEVKFYIFEPEDPLIQTWNNIFPDLLKNKNEMPENLLTHIRYPSDLLQTQGLVYSKYHMTDPTVFYNQEDLWVQATEKYYGSTQPVEPYYIMWESPGSDQPQFILMLPFTPKNKQVLISWIAGICDPENYGKLLAYKFPKEKRVLGTQQVETKIDQDRILSQRLSLWDQRGSRVIRGNVLVIPVEETLLYVEPIYLQAETAAYPELRLVVVMHNDVISYAENFEKALKGLLGKRKPELKPEKRPLEKTKEVLIDQAAEAFDTYLKALGQRDFPQASKQLEKLSDTLENLTADEPNQPK